MSNFESTFKPIAQPEGKVRVDISYDIIRQFSSQLYSNPRKAIEELVCNSYDAGATECHVRVPKERKDALVVLDNGESMDLEGLKSLWMVAKSPKARASGARIDNNRLQIGKFGVGKLAAYSLGKRLTHIATIKNVTRVVSVGEGQLKDRRSPPSFKVYKAKEAAARAIVEPLLGNLPRPWEENWTSWTIAVVEDVLDENFERALKIGILRRMIATALPIFKDFKVFLDATLVPERDVAEEDIELSVDVLNADFRSKLELDLKQFWADKRHEPPEDVSDEFFKIKLVDMRDPRDVRKKVKAIEIPRLGPIAGNAILATKSLTTEKLDERGYLDHGFHIRAHGKLVNPEDDLFGITQRSHAYWRRFLARVEIPGLDDVLLVQRNAVSENSEKAQLAREVLRTLFNFTRSLAEEKSEAQEFAPRTLGSKLKGVAPLLLPLALEGLAGGEPPVGGVAELDIDFFSLGEDTLASQYDVKTNTIQINEDHPLIAALDELEGESQRQWRRVMGELIAGCKLAEGLLLAKQVDQTIVEEIGELIDASLRSAASYIRDPVQEHILEIEEASYEGDRRFENAVVNAFRSLRLVARRRGGPDNPDGIVEIPVTGNKNLKISVEAKGSKGVVTHQDLSESTVARHRRESGCTHSVAIAREYQESGKSGKKSALLRETDGRLPLLTVAAIGTLLRLHQKRPFTYDKVATILTTWTAPSDLVQFIENQWKELPELGLMKVVLTVAHEKAAEHDQNLPDPGMLVGDNRLSKRRVTKDDVKHILEAVAITTGMIVIRNQQTYEFELKAPVETILEAMTTAAKEDASSLH